MKKSSGTRRSKHIDVLLIDDDRNFLAGLAEHLHLLTREFNIITAGSAEKALSLLDMAMFDIVVTDLNMPGMNGFELLQRLGFPQQVNPGMKTIIMSAYDRSSVDYKLKDLCFADFIEKPLDADTLCRLIRDVWQR